MSNTLNQLRQSVAALQSGNLPEAIRLAQAILLLDPKNFDAHHIVALASYHARDIATAQLHIARALAIRSDMPDAFNTQGLILRAQGKTAEAAEAFARAARLNPRSREAHYNLANACQDLGRLPVALEHYDAALRIDPGMVMAWNNRGLALRKMGRAAEALASFEEAVRRAPDFAPAHYNRADALASLQRTEEALAGYDRAIALNPGLAEAHCNRANALMELGRTAEALAGYDRAVALQPGFHQAQMSRSIALAAAGREPEAEAGFRRAIALRPDYADAHYNLGKLLHERGRSDEAVASYDEAIRLRPGHAETHTNRGNALKELGRFDEAVACHDRALALKPDYVEAHYNRANALIELKRAEEALASFDKALALRPSYAEAAHNKSLLLLALGRYREGFPLYAARWGSAGFGSVALKGEVPRWDGSGGEGEVLVWAEQGIGDEILHGSLLPLVGPDVRITLAADPRLHAIYQRSLPHVRVIDSAVLRQPVSGYRAQAPVGDLGAILGVDSEMLAKRPRRFLTADAARRAALRASPSFPPSGPVVGLSWKSANKRIGAEKSLRLAELAPLLSEPGLSFVNLQYGAVADDIAEAKALLGVEIREIEGLDVFNDIDGLLALVDACDLVVTTSNVTAHLAGALGKKAVVLVPAGKGLLWYWQGGDNNLWYPSLTRAAQPRIGDWQPAIASAAAWVRDNT